jgi:ParB/RepB/Spo0J family partition protein
MSQVSNGQFGNIPIQFIETDPKQPRRTFDAEKLQELADSIKESGMLQPIVLRTIPDSDTRLLIVAGERRYRAAQLAGLTEVPGIVRQLTDAEVAIMQLVENHQRDGVVPLEEAEAMQTAMTEHGLKIDELCKRMGVKKRWAYTRLQLLNLHEDARPALADGRLSASTALLIARIPVPTLQQRATNEVLSNHGRPTPMSYRDAKNWIEGHYTLDFNRAAFSLTDTKLCVDAGSCAKCPKRTANAPDQFPDTSGDVCTDPDCFQAKTDAHNTAEIAKATKKKIPLYESWEQCKAERNGDLSTGFVLAHTFSRLTDDKHKAQPVDDLLGADQMPKPVGIFKNHSGNITQIFSKKDLQCALENAGFARTVEQETALASQAEAESPQDSTSAKVDNKAAMSKIQRQQEMGAAYNAFRQEVFDTAKDCIKLANVSTIYRLLAKITFAIDAEIEVFGMAEKSADTYSFAFDDQEQVANVMDDASDEDICRVFVDYALSSYVRVHFSYIKDGELDPANDLMAQTSATLFQLAQICEVDVDAIKKQHLGKFDEEPAPVVETPMQAAKPKAKKTATVKDGNWPFPTGKAIAARKAAEADAAQGTPEVKA